jgi:hypothetical protein
MRRLNLLLVALAYVMTTGCIVVDDGKRHDHDKDDYSSDSKADDNNGAGFGSDDDHGSAQASPPPEEHHEHHEDSTPKEHTYYVGGYQPKYSQLPEMGETKRYFRAHGNRANWDRGYFNGELRCNGGGLIKQGAGKGETVIDGDVSIEGNNWKYSGMTFTGDVKIRGDNNDISDCEVFGHVDVRGMGNKTP